MLNHGKKIIIEDDADYDDNGMKKIIMEEDAESWDDEHHHEG